MTPAEARRHLDGLPAAIQASTAAALDRVAEALAAEARRQLVAADPSGMLAAAIGTGRDGGGATMVTVAAPFAAALEYGTRRMAARPFLRLAIAVTGDAARQIMAEAFTQAVTQSKGDA